MPDARRLIALSASVEQALWGSAALVVLALLVRAWRAPRPATPMRLALTRRAERVAIAIVLTWTLAARLVGYASPQQPRFYFAQAPTLHVAEAMHAPDVGRRWLDLLGNLQVRWEHESPIQAPVAALFQVVLGPSFELPMFIGAFWGTLTVLLAWRLGRAVESPAFGVLLAAIVAISPLQIVWTRLGGVYIGAGTAVLAALLAGWHVGRARGAVAALLLGVGAWSCVYLYYPARLGTGLAAVGLWAGWRRSGRGLWRLGGLLAALGTGFATCLLVHRHIVPGQSIWPDYANYLGGRGETSVQDMIASAVVIVRSQLSLTLDEYFWRDRMLSIAHVTTVAPSRWLLTALAPGMNAGGLVLLPVLVAGAIGLLRALRHPIEHGLWLAFALSSILPPLLGYPSARRFLVFDLAWCALAALGLRALLESRLLAPATSAARRRWACGLLAAVGLWSAATLALSYAALPTGHVAMPFGDSGFGDGATCLACVDTARAWQREIEHGRMVVAFDTDMYRENATAPGGLMLYGKIAALAAGRSDRFLDYYPLVANYDTGPPHPGRFAPTMPERIADALAGPIDAAHPSAVVWWFAQPNAWERRLADALVRAGSRLTRPPARAMWSADRLVLSAPPLRVVTPAARIPAALAALGRFVDPPMPQEPCVRLERVTRRYVAQQPLLLAPMATTADGVPQWAIGSWGEVQVWGHDQRVAGPVGLAYRTGADGRRSAEVVDVAGTASAWTPSGDTPSREPAPGPRPLGRHCAAMHGGRWWVVDPIGGGLWMPGASARAELPDAIGIAAFGDRLVIATADQRVLVLDPDGPEVVREFPAASVPARFSHFGECALLAAGRDWVAMLDQLRGILFLYDAGGAPLGRLPLAEAAGASWWRALNAIGGTGNDLGVAHDLAVTTLRVVRDGACAAPGAPARP